MLQAFHAVGDPHFKVELFNNALEEMHHFALFNNMAMEYSDFPLPYTAERRKQLFDPATGLIRFEANHYVGEGDVYEQFLTYASATRVDRVRDMFMDIRGDEEEHQKLAYRELIRLCKGEKSAQKLIRSVRLSRFYESWVRVSKGIGGYVSGIVLSLLYFVSAPFFSPLCRRRIDGLEWKKQLRAAGAPPTARES